MGMRENTESVYVMDSATNMQKKERRVCTVGGPFPEGARLIKKVRSLNNYFNSPQRVERLTKLQQFYGLPELSPIVDCDTRVASSVTLFQRTIVNYSAFRDYFRHDDPQVFANLSEDEWELLVEMQAITGSLADLARIEVQWSNQVASELIVLLKAAFDRLSTDKYQIYNIDAVRTPKTNENSLPRREVHLSTLPTNAQVCVRRIKSQVAKRVPTLTAESVVILLLDPRTKFTVSDLVRPAKFAEAGIAGPSTDAGDVGAAAIDAVIEDAWLSTDAGDVDAAAIDTVIEDGKTILRNAHREVYCSMHANDLSGAQIKELDMPPNLDLVPSVHDELVMCGAPVPAEALPKIPWRTSTTKPTESGTNGTSTQCNGCVLPASKHRTRCCQRKTSPVCSLSATMAMYAGDCRL
ncbi:hypothetical protein DVH05_023783 [Phytophthora capsici]|nr:hypothetical protein DVH05_023783 [Phytophthora capsici]